MKLHEILLRARIHLEDNETPYLWNDLELVDYLNEAINEACERGRLFKESPPCARPTSLALTVAGTAGATTYGYKVSALVGSRESLPCEEVSVTTGNATLGAVNYNTLTWASVLGATSYRIYRNTSGGTPATTGLIGTATGVTFNDTGIAVSSTTIPTTTPCQLAVGANAIDIALDTRTLDIDEQTVKLVSMGYQLTRKSAADLYSAFPTWRTEVASSTLYYCVDEVDGYISIYPRRSAADTLEFSCYRLPLSQMSLASMNTEPEIDSRFHIRLPRGIAARAYLKDDSQTYNPQKAIEEKALWRADIDAMAQARLKIRSSYGYIGPNRGAI
jgi:hypothetical protein